MRSSLLTGAASPSRFGKLSHPSFAPAIELEVRDTGPGIKAEMVEQAFQTCAQLSHSSIRSHRGMGLGLARGAAQRGGARRKDHRQNGAASRVPLSSL